MRLLVVAAMALALAATKSHAEQAFPTRSVRVIDAYSAGGSSDLAMRLLVDAFSRELKQSVYIENKPGAGGQIGTAAFLDAAPDGYTLMIAANAILVVAPAAKTVRYDPEKDFIPIGLIWRIPQVLAVRPGLNVNNLSQLITRAKSADSHITMGSAGVGTSTHLAMELLKYETKGNFTHIPFRGTGNSLQALLSDQIDGLFGDVTILAPYVQSKKVIGLALTGSSRSRLLPDLQTTAEAGLPVLASGAWFGLAAPAKTPPEIVAKLRAALKAAQMDPTYRRNVAAKGVDIENWDAESFAALIKSDRAKWTPIIRAAGIKLD
jgi:tripartite-type tricarboxylate transporter receptor subunit TctC